MPDKNNPLEKAKQALQTISGTPAIDVDYYVSAVLNATEKRMERQFVWFDVVNKLEYTAQKSDKDMSQQFVDSITQEYGSISLGKRNTRYKEYVSIIKKLPIIFKIIKVYKANILSPDDITKFSFRYVASDPTLDDDPEVRSIQSRYKLIAKTIDLEKYVDQIVQNTLMLGDMYLEIVAAKRYLMQTLLNLQIPIGEANEVLSNFSDTEDKEVSKFKMDTHDDKKFTLTIESAKPITSQMSSLNECLDVSLNDGKFKNLKVLHEALVSPKGPGEEHGSDSGGNDQIQHLVDILPVKGTMSNISLKIHMPHRIVKLEHDGICYGYLYIKEGATNDGVSLYGSSAKKETNNDTIKGIVTKLSDYIKTKFGDKENSPDIDDMAPGLQTLIADILISGSNEAMVRYIPPSNIQHIKIQGTGAYEPYGESIIDNLMFRSTLLLADDVASVIYNIGNTGKRTVFTVRGNTAQQAAARIQDIKTAVNKRTVTLDKIGSIDMIPSIISGVENYYIPKIGDEPTVDISTVELGTYTDKSDPNMYQVKQLITGADIPPAHLGYDEFVNAKATLASESVVFARGIIALQKEFGEQFTELFQKIYRALYMSTKEFNMAYLDVVVTFNSPRAILLESESGKATNLETIVNALKNLGIPEERIIRMYCPELLDEDSKTKAIADKLSKKTKGEETGEESGGGDFAPFDGGDMGGGDLGMAPPGETTDEVPSETGTPPADMAPPV